MTFTRDYNADPVKSLRNAREAAERGSTQLRAAILTMFHRERRIRKCSFERARLVCVNGEGAQ